jgi:hypothetical protein
MRKWIIGGAISLCAIGIWWWSGEDDRYSEWVRNDWLREQYYEQSVLQSAANVETSPSLQLALERQADALGKKAFRYSENNWALWKKEGGK